MTKSLTNLLGIIITILAGTYFYLNYCSTCRATVEEVPVVVIPIVPDPTSYPFAFDSGDYEYKVNDNYNFNVSSFNILTNLSQNVTDGIDGLQVFLTKNPGKSLNITGYYNSNEENNSAFPNLGLARANAVKNHMVSNGISSTQINTSGELLEEMVPKEDIYLGPVAYALAGESEDMGAQLQTLLDNISKNPLILNFGTAEFSMDLSSEQRVTFADISKILDKIPGAICLIVGHTDDTATAVTNLRLGKERSVFAKEYLISQGIDSSKINTESKGESSPIATNDTEEGRSKNRRAVITIQSK